MKYRIIVFIGLLMVVAPWIRAQEPVLDEPVIDKPVIDEAWGLGDPLVAWFPVGEDLDFPEDGVIPAEPIYCGDDPQVLQLDQGEFRLYSVLVDTNVIYLEIQLEGDNGDADLYVRHNEPPTNLDYDHRPFVTGSQEAVILEEPAAGVWYVAVHAAKAVENLSLSIACSFTLITPSIAQTRAPRDIELAMYYEFSDITLPEDGAWSSERRNRKLRDDGRTAFNVGEFQDAIDIWTEWSRVDPLNPEPVALIGDAYLRQEAIETAISFYRKSLEIQPGQIALITRLARLLDQSMEDAHAARELLNFYEQLFPGHPDLVLAKAEWLLRRKRFDEAGKLIRTVIERDPQNLRAYALLHGLLETPGERFDNMRTIRQTGLVAGREMALATAISDNSLLTRPESWVMMDSIHRMALSAPSKPAREAFAALMPRKKPAIEDFRLGRMSDNWVSSQEQMWSEDGSLLLSADLAQTEAYLRLKNSEAMHNGYVEVEISEARGFFWLYARRGEGNMIRFGFDETGMMYQQIWMDNQLMANDQRLWSKPEGTAMLRMEIRADGVMTLVDGRPAFGSPMTIPRDMGLGWWGIAPWSPNPGVAAAQVFRVAGGPLPVRLAVLNYPLITTRTPEQITMLQSWMKGASVLAPYWYVLGLDGSPFLLPTAQDAEIRLLSRYYRARLLPLIRVRDLTELSWEALIETARRDRLDGFTLPVDKMPPPAWIHDVEEKMVDASLSLILLQPDARTRRVNIMEISPYVSLFTGGRRQWAVPYQSADTLAADYNYDELGDTVLQLCPEKP